MNKEDKKVPDTPERLFVGPFSKPIPDNTNSSSFAAMKTWVGIKNKLMAEDEEYINLSHAWHEKSEVPHMDETIVVADKDYMNPKILDLDNVTDSYIYVNMKDNEIWEKVIEEHDFVHWAYYTCFIPLIALTK